MGTIIYDELNLSVTRFFGGRDQGICYQITVNQDYTQLSRAELKAFAQAMLDELKKTEGSDENRIIQ